MIQISMWHKHIFTPGDAARCSKEEAVIQSLSVSEKLDLLIKPSKKKKHKSDKNNHVKGFSSFCLANKHFTSSCYFNDPWLWNETLQLMRCMLLINCSCCRKKKKTINLPHSSVLNANHCDCTSDEERHLYCRSSAARSDSVSSEIDFTLSSQLTLFS